MKDFKIIRKTLKKDEQTILTFEYVCDGVTISYFIDGEYITNFILVKQTTHSIHVRHYLFEDCFLEGKLDTRSFIKIE